MSNSNSNKTHMITYNNGDTYNINIIDLDSNNNKKFDTSLLNNNILNLKNNMEFNIEEIKE